MQPKFTLKTLGLISFRVIALVMVLALTAQNSFSQTNADKAARQEGSKIVQNSLYAPGNDLMMSRPASSQPQTQNGSSRVAAPTVISTLGGTGYNGAFTINLTTPLGISFVVENTTGQTIKITDVTCLVGPTGVTPAGTPAVTKLFYSTTSISGNYDLNAGWTQIGTGAVVVPAVTTNMPVISGISFNIPAGAQYRFVIEVSRGLLFAFTPTPTPNIFSAGGVNLKVGNNQIAAQDIGFAGDSPVPNAGNHPAFFCGSITWDVAVCIPNNATQPVISSVPSNTCAGSPITLSIIAGSLNGAANWRWYSGSCGGTLVGTGTSITVSPGVTTTYFARGEGGCAPANGPCGQQTVTVTPCTCLTPDVATICSGSTQLLTVTPTGATTQTFGPGPAVTITDPTGTPYPSTINVAGLPTAGAYVQSVTINGFSHTWPEDVDLALLSPSGQISILMSDVGGANSTSNTNLIFNESGTVMTAAPLINNNVYKPTNLVGQFGVEPDNFPAPGTGTLTTVGLNAFSSSNNPNGAWRLLVVDDFGGDNGSLTGWSITFRIVPTATWTANPAAPNTMFTNSGTTTPYVAGSQTDAIYVNPTTTTTYTATFSGGACAPTQSVTVTVLPKPNIQITPNPGGCAPVTLTATGGIAYTWSPSTGLSATTGSSVVATPQVNTTYSVFGYGANGCSNTANVDVKGISTAAVITADPPFETLFAEGFNTVVPAGWVSTNRSNPVGATNWFQGNTAVFPAQSGPPTSYAAANFNNVATLGQISNWLITPPITVKDRDTLVFWTRKVAPDAFPDRMQVRMSSGGTNVGATDLTVGDFTTLLLDINPTEVTGVYPVEWKRFTIPVTGTPNPTTVRYAFRYFVSNGGLFGANSDFIGVDEVLVKRPLPGLCPNTVATISVSITGGVPPYTLVFTNGTTQTTYAGYTSGTSIQVSPATTTSYTIVSVTGANGCPGIGNTGTATVTVVTPPAITAQPTNQVVCVGGSATFTVGATPNVFTTSYQWQVSTDNGATWNNIPAGAPYTGTTTTSLTVSPVTSAMNGYRYRLVVTGQCAPQVATSASATLQVNVPPVINTQPVGVTVCDGKTATFSVGATAAVGTVSYQWQVSVDNGITWTNAPGASTSATYSFTATLLMNNYRYRVIVSTPPCATTVTSTAIGVVLTVNPLPVVNITSADLAITPGQTTTITGTSNPAAAPNGWTWTLNGAVYPAPPATPANTSSITVGIDALGVYQATATTALTGCTGTSNLLTIGAEASDHMWIYPNPNNGNFQIRLFFDGNVAERRRIRIYNSKGGLVAQKEFSLVQGNPSYMSMEFQLPKLAAGTYVAKVTGLNSGNTISGLFVIAQ